MPLAYSYIRFSSARQELGDSLRRQVELSSSYAAKHGLTLDESLTFRDLGVSAFDRTNVQSGALRAFLDAIREGHVKPGSFLLVESLDRISRAQITAATSVFLEIINADVTIVTMADGQKYSRDSIDANWAQLIISLTILSRAHEESQTKSRRIRAAWESKRRRAANEKLTRRCPAWMEATADRKQFVLKPTESAIVHKIVDWSLDGLGQASIARKLNRESVPNITGSTAGWQSSYIAKILSSTALYGEARFTTRSGGTKRETLEGIPNYYPPLITREKWLTLQAVRKQRNTGGGPVRRGQVSNLFAGLLRCGYCNGPMTIAGYAKKDPIKDKKYFVCANAKRGRGCYFLQWNLRKVEFLLLSFLSEVDVVAIFGTCDSQASSATSVFVQLQEELAEAEGRLSNVVAAIEMGQPPQALLSRAASIEAEIATLRGRLSAAELNVARMPRSESEVIEHQTAIRAIVHASDSEEVHQTRRKLATHIRRVIDHVQVWAGGSGYEPQYDDRGNFTCHKLLVVRKDQRSLSVHFPGGGVVREIWETSVLGKPVSLDLP